MHITFLIHSLNMWGGAERQMVVLARGLHAAGERVSVVCHGEAGEMAAPLRAEGIPVQALHKRSLTDIGFSRRLIDALRELQPDVLHSYLTDANLIAKNVSLLFPQMCVVWGLRATNADLAFYSRLDGLRHRLCARLSAGVDAIIHNSEAGRAFYHSQGYSDRQAVVIENGIDVTTFAPDPAARARVRSEWGLRDRHTLIGNVARLTPAKDHATFLKAAALYHSAHPEARFAIVGGDHSGMQERLRSLAADLDLPAEAVIWAGRRSDINAVHNACDMLTLSSAYGEGFPNVLAEAMATGTPCVTTPSGDAARLVGEWGQVVPAGDAITMAQAWGRLRHHAPAATDLRAHIVDHFSQERLVQRTRDLLHGLGA